MPIELSRRSLLRTSLAAPAAVAAPAMAAPDMSAQVGHTALAAAANASFYRFELGAFQITIVSDGAMLVPVAALGTNIDPTIVADFLQSRHLNPFMNLAHANQVLIDTGEAKVLVDVGSGERFVDGVGKLSSNLAAAGIRPEEITHVLLTHAHPDHAWGLIDAKTGQPRFSAATHAIAAAEFDWWMAPDRAQQVPGTMRAMVAGAQNALQPLAERMVMVEGETQIVPGVHMIGSAGHTPGHMAVAVESQGQGLLVLGDVLNHAYISFEHPDWHFDFDIDKEQAAVTRRRMLDLAVEKRLTIAGAHLPFPGIGQVMRRDGAYQFLPRPWEFTG